MGYPLSLTVPVQSLVLAFWGDFVVVESWGLLLVGTAGVTVAASGQPLVETVPSTRWSLPWQRGRSWGPVVVVSPSGSKLVGLAEG